MLLNSFCELNGFFSQMMSLRDKIPVQPDSQPKCNRRIIENSENPLSSKAQNLKDIGYRIVLMFAAKPEVIRNPQNLL